MTHLERALAKLREQCEQLDDPEGTAALGHLDAALTHLGVTRTWIDQADERKRREAENAKAAEAARLAREAESGDGSQ